MVYLVNWMDIIVGNDVYFVLYDIVKSISIGRIVILKCYWKCNIIVYYMKLLRFWKFGFCWSMMFLMFVRMNGEEYFFNCGCCSVENINIIFILYV